jgi:hypothetical protein
MPYRLHVTRDVHRTDGAESMPDETPTFQLSHADKCRAGALKWRDAPPGLSPKLANKFMAELKAGKTLRALTSGSKAPATCTPERYKKHCELDPEWGLAANQLAKANAKAADALKGNSRAEETHCRRGHPYETYGFFRPYTGNKGPAGRLFRCCKACQYLAAKKGAKLSAEVVDKVKALLRAGNSLSSFTQSGRGGRLCSFVSVQRLRRENKEFDNIVSLSQQRRLLLRSPRLVAVSKPAIITSSNLRTAVLTGSIAGRADMVFSAISEAVSFRLPRHIRDEVMGQLFLDVEEGHVALSEIRQFARKYTSDIYEEEKHRISLDAPVFRDGTGKSKLDRISESDGLWA